MIIIWRGLGFIVPIIAIACFFVTQLATTSIFQDDRYYTEHGWPKLFAFWLAAVLVGIIGLLLSRKGTKIYIDKATGEEIVMRPNHSFFFIPVLYWAPILVILGIVFLFI
jgi:hypothetical protein